MSESTTNNIITEAVDESTEETVVTVGENTTEVYDGVETFDPDNSNVENMIDTLPMMGKGMLGIFLVTVLIVAAVAVLNKTTNRTPKE